MEYNAINRVLAQFEAAILNGSVDEFLNRDSLINAAKQMESASLNSEKNISQFADSILQALKTDEFREVVRTIEFQGLHDITYSLPPLIQGGLKEFFEGYRFYLIGKTKAWKKFVELMVVKQIECDHELLTIGIELLSEKLRTQFSPCDIGIFFQEDRIRSGILGRLLCFFLPRPSVIGEYFQNDGLPSRIIQFQICNTDFDLNLKQFSKGSITEYLTKYLTADNYKKKIIHDTVQLCKELASPKFIAQNEAWYMLYYLTSLHDFIYEKECALFNFIFRQRKQNGWISQTFTKEDISRYMAPEELFLFCINAGSNVNEMRNFYNNNFGAIWHNYINSIDAEESHPTMGFSKRLREKLALSLFASLKTDINVNPIIPNPKKEKLPCDNYLYAALLYEKSLKTDVEFLPLCREAANSYCSKKGKEFSGEQLANVFYQELKKFDSFAEFCKPEYNGDRMKKLKKKLNWHKFRRLLPC